MTQPLQIILPPMWHVLYCIDCEYVEAFPTLEEAKEKAKVAPHRYAICSFPAKTFEDHSQKISEISLTLPKKEAKRKIYLENKAFYGWLRQECKRIVEDRIAKVYPEYPHIKERVREIYGGPFVSCVLSEVEREPYITVEEAVSRCRLRLK